MNQLNKRLFGGKEGLLGMIVSFQLDWPSGATITLVAAAGFVAAGAARELRTRTA